MHPPQIFFRATARSANGTRSANGIVFRAVLFDHGSGGFCPRRSIKCIGASASRVSSELSLRRGGGVKLNSYRGVTV